MLFSHLLLEFPRISCPYVDMYSYEVYSGSAPINLHSLSHPGQRPAIIPPNLPKNREKKSRTHGVPPLRGSVLHGGDETCRSCGVVSTTPAPPPNRVRLCLLPQSYSPGPSFGSLVYAGSRPEADRETPRVPAAYQRQAGPGLSYRGPAPHVFWRPQWHHRPQEPPPRFIFRGPQRGRERRRQR